MQRAFSRHICICFTQLANIIWLEIIGKSDPVYFDGADFSPLINLAGVMLDKTLVGITSIASFLVNTLLFTAFMAVFNRLYFKTVPEQKQRFVKIIKIILTLLSSVGAVLLLIVNHEALPGAFSEIFLHYLLFAVLMNILVRRKITKILKESGEDAD